MFVLKEDGSLIPMKPAQFVLEEHFQQLLEDHPELLAGDLIDPDEPRRWLLVAREIGIPGESDGTGWWSADHLFLDQDGIPTIVEVKRQTDTRLRREVVGQMLDYAANAVAYLPVASIRARFEDTCAKKEKDPDHELQDRLGQDIDTEKFWLQVKTNLEAQKIRLLFVADVIPRELRRIVEFLNRQMNPVEVLALELRQFSGENGLRTLMPTLYGQTEEARGVKSSPPSRNWDEETVFNELETRFDNPVVDVARSIANWMKTHADKIIFGHGKVDGSMTAMTLYSGEKLYPLTISTQGKVYINFVNCKRGPFQDSQNRLKWLAKFNEIPGLSLTPDCIDKMPPVAFALLSSGGRINEFLKVMDWFISVLKNVQPELIDQ
jgi:hypothetical protein